jgi:hypothetical protein
VFAFGERRHAEVHGYYWISRDGRNDPNRQYDADGNHPDGSRSADSLGGFPKWSSVYYWTDPNGGLIGTPSQAATRPFRVESPAENTRLCVRVNDDIYFDNAPGDPPMQWRVF